MVWRQLTRGLRALFDRSAADRDVADEVQDYLEHAAATHRAQGLPPDAALRAARMELGNVTGVREQVRAVGWENLVETVLFDLRYTARRLRATPGFTAVTVFTLALGVGATTAMFSVLNPILFASLPYPEPRRITSILEGGNTGTRIEGTFAMYRELATRAHSFAAIAALKPWRPTLTGTDQVERLEGQRVSAGYFQVLGVPPAIGRDFDASDDQRQGPNVVILSDALWRRRFGGDRAIVGRPVALNDDLYTVIAVLPAGFENVLTPGAELWAPLQYDPSLPVNGREWGHHLRTIGRLRPGVGVDQATLEVDALGRAMLGARHPATYDPNTRFAVASLHDELTRGVRPALLAVFGAALLVLLIACVNVTNLLLARGVQRRAEFALRAALGAGHPRLIRQLLTESLALAVLGGVLGAVVAVVGVRGLVALAPAGLPRAGAIQVNGSVFAFALGLTALIGLAFGLIPALQAARGNSHQELQHGTRRSVGGHRRTRNALVVAEVALALVLLVSSGLLLRSLSRLFAVPVGFDSSGVLTMQVQVAGHRFDQDSDAFRLFERALTAVRGTPGVTAAALTSQLPLSGDRDEYGASFEPTPTLPARTYPVFRYAVSADYDRTLHIPLRLGRALDDHDGAAAPLVALISESLARERFRGEDPIGQRLRIGPAGPYAIVGVVGDVKQMSLALNESNAVYVPARQWPWADRVVSLVVRAGGNAAALAPAVRQAVWSVDKDQPVVRVATMDRLLAASTAERRFALIVFAVFAVAALVLAAAGIFGVLAGSVAERTREIGVRAALGASRRDILALIMRQGMTLTGIGVALGLAGAVAATRALVAMLFGVTRLDPVTYAGVIVLLGGVAAFACSVPAWRAAHVDPATTLRAE